ncbi:MAG: hypothetical protein R3337_12030, partial [Gammaproteobacteria bacterium]|nr:hypothetical protein [Gammaproteobacteria bacterium]
AASGDVSLFVIDAPLNSSRIGPRNKKTPEADAHRGSLIRRALAAGDRRSPEYSSGRLCHYQAVFRATIDAHHFPETERGRWRDASMMRRTHEIALHF